MNKEKNQHKPASIEKAKMGNVYIKSNSPDDNLEIATGDQESLMAIDNPDDFFDEGNSREFKDTGE